MFTAEGIHENLAPLAGDKPSGEEAVADCGLTFVCRIGLRKGLRYGGKQPRFEVRTEFSDERPGTLPVLEVTLDIVSNCLPITVRRWVTQALL